MRRDSTRPLVLILLITLAAPAPRMASWLLGGSPSRGFATTRHEPPCRGRNRLPAASREIRSLARAALASAAEGLDRSGGRASSFEAGPAGLRSPIAPCLLLPATRPGPLHLRC